MSHVINIAYALYLRTRVRQYVRSKQMALALTKGQRTPPISLIDYWTYLWHKYCECGFIQAFLRTNMKKRFVGWLYLGYKTITTHGTFPNYIATSILGFMGGILVTYLYFTFATLMVDLSIHTAWYFSVGLCMFITISLAFSSLARCIFISMLPEVFTRKVRNILISYALLLLITGPGANILYNTKQLTQTITCTKEQLGEVSRNLTEIYMKPLRALKQGITNLVYKIKPVVDQIKSFLVHIKNGIQSVARSIRKGLDWLHGFTGLCNNKVGSPYDRCTRALERAVEDCKVRVWSYLAFLCNLAEIASLVCQSFKLLSLVCVLHINVNFDFLESIDEKIEELGRFIKSMLYVSISFHHSFEFETNSSKSFKSIILDTFHSEERRLTSFFKILGAAKLFLGAYILYVVFSTLVYRSRFMHQLYYDNYHINKFIINLDQRRAAVQRQTIFPLTTSEKRMYVSLFSLRLTANETLHMLKDSVFILMSAIKMTFLLLIDFALHWVLRLLDQHGRLNFSFDDDKAKIVSEGSGLWWILHRIINDVLQPTDVEFHFDTGPCLPEPIPPAYHTYKRVGSVLLLSWLTVLFQPFGLRFRSHVMSNFYPEVARRRAVWLYNHILMARGNLTLYIRRQLRGKSPFGLRTDRPDFRKWLLSKFPRLAVILPYRNMYKECMVCGYKNPTVTCVTPDCPGTYCKDCLQLLHDICMICNMIQYLEKMDVSEEEDSEEDIDVVENGKPGESKLQKSWWKFWSHRTQVQESISLRDVEHGEFDEQLVYAPLLKDSNTERDYFGDRWRRTDWASEDDYLFPLPDFSSWVRPQFQQPRTKKSTISVRNTDEQVNTAV